MLQILFLSCFFLPFIIFRNQFFFNLLYFQIQKAKPHRLLFELAVHNPCVQHVLTMVLTWIQDLHSNEQRIPNHQSIASIFKLVLLFYYIYHDSLIIEMRAAFQSLSKACPKLCWSMFLACVSQHHLYFPMENNESQGIWQQQAWTHKLSSRLELYW